MAALVLVWNSLCFLVLTAKVSLFAVRQGHRNNFTDLSAHGEPRAPVLPGHDLSGPATPPTTFSYIVVSGVVFSMCSIFVRSSALPFRRIRPEGDVCCLSRILARSEKFSERNVCLSIANVK